MTTRTVEQIRELAAKAIESNSDPDEAKCARQNIMPLLARIAELEETLARVSEWTHKYGAALCPKGPDTYGEGMRDAKQQVGCILFAALKGGG